jgi:hypothetical protein
MADVFSVLSPEQILALDVSKQEKINSSAGTRATCVPQYCGASKNLPSQPSGD